jgi:hypothetical protein
MKHSLRFLAITAWLICIPFGFVTFVERDAGPLPLWFAYVGTIIVFASPIVACVAYYATGKRIPWLTSRLKSGAFAVVSTAAASYASMFIMINTFGS